MFWSFLLWFNMAVGQNQKLWLTTESPTEKVPGQSGGPKASPRPRSEAPGAESAAGGANAATALGRSGAGGSSARPSRGRESYVDAFQVERPIPN